jgi:hypothetical protein
MYAFVSEQYYLIHSKQRYYPYETSQNFAFLFIPHTYQVEEEQEEKKKEEEKKKKGEREGGKGGGGGGRGRREEERRGGGRRRRGGICLKLVNRECFDKVIIHC